MALIVKDDISFNHFELNININRGNLDYVTLEINTKSLDKLIICSYYSPREIVYEQLFEKFGNKLNNLLITGEFNAIH